MNESPIHVKHDIIPYCATCRKAWDRDDKRRLGVRFRCPYDKGAPPGHVAALVKGEVGKTWLHIEAAIVKYEFFRIKVFKRFFATSVPLRYTTMVVLLLISLALMHCGTLGVAAGCLISAFIIIDTLLGTTSVAFFTRFPAHPLRTVVLSLFSFLLIVSSFGTFFKALSSSFCREIEGTVDAIYFSFVTITTLGYGEIEPISPTSKFVVIFELIVGLYFLVILLSIFASWINKTPDISIPTFEELFPERRKE